MMPRVLFWMRMNDDYAEVIESELESLLESYKQDKVNLSYERNEESDIYSRSLKKYYLSKLDSEHENTPITEQSIFIYGDLYNLDIAKDLIKRSTSIKAIVNVWAESVLGYEDLLNRIMDECADMMELHLSSDKSWCVKYSAFNHKCKEDDMRLILERLDPIFINAGPVQLSSPDTRIVILEDYSLIKSTNEKILKRTYFGNIICDFNDIQYIWDKYALSNRPILGPTTLENILSFIMCNLAQVRVGSIVLDPFVGSGGSLITATALGAHCIGTDIDVRILKGWGISYRNPNFTKDISSTDIFYNFAHYNIENPDIIRTDNRNNPWRSNEWIDAIIADPPYGIRASAKHNKLSKLLHGRRETSDNMSDQLVLSLLDLASYVLVPGGLLVFLLPVLQDRIKDSLKLLKRDQLKVKHIGQQKLSAGISRFMVTMEKMGT